MARFVNTFALSTETVSSASLGPLGMVVHQMVKPGRFFGRVYADDIEVGQFELQIDEGSELGQADIDLSLLVTRPGTAPGKAKRFKLSKEGFVIFFVSKGQSGYSVTLEAPAKEKKIQTEVVFDSTKLSKNDLFVSTLIRPGLWTAHDRVSSGLAEITVDYPKIGKSAYRPREDATTINVTEKGINPTKAHIGPGEGVIFKLAYDGSSISLSLNVPDDGKPAKKGAPKTKGKKRRVRWTNPRQKQP